MLRKFTVIITIFVTSFVLLSSPVQAEEFFVVSLNNSFINYNQLSNIYATTKQVGSTIGDGIETVGSIISDGIEIVGDSVGSFNDNFIDYNQLSSMYNTTKEVVGTVEDTMETVGNIVEIVTVGGTIICITGSIASTTVLPPAAALLPYCSAIGILDSGHAVTKVVKKPTKALSILSHAF